MGIKNLWYILEPYSEKKPSYVLEGKIVAIDLSCWVCESLNVVNYFVQPKMYLRNLFFRTSYLLLSGVTPVFVLEGSAPKLKYGVICKRNETNNFIGARPKKPKSAEDTTKETTKTAEKGRTHFNYVLKQCEELLKSMGLICVQAPGEAEAFCAYLNKENLVDGIISQDSDCFAYGARIVYRNFAVSAKGGSIDVYDMERIRKHNDIGQNKMVVLGLLCGCDYCPNGIPGIGKDSVLKLFERYKNDEILSRIRSWRQNNNNYTALEIRVDDKSLCVNCGHYGTAQKHGSKGCGTCRTSAGCDESLWKNERLLIKAELNIRKHALKDEQFPSEDIINEFLLYPCDLPALDLKWRQPNIVKFVKDMSHMLQWSELYSFSKILPLFTRCQLKKMIDPSNTLRVYLSVDVIEKKRNIKGIRSYDILWVDEKKFFETLIPELKTDQDQKLWVTTEPADLVDNSYPEVVEKFIEKTEKPKKVPKKRKVPKENVDPKQAKLNFAVAPKNIKKKKKDPVDALKDINDVCSLVDSFSELNFNNENKNNESDSVTNMNNYDYEYYGIPSTMDNLSLNEKFVQNTQDNNLNTKFGNLLDEIPTENMKLFKETSKTLKDENTDFLGEVGTNTYDEYYDEKYYENESGEEDLNMTDIVHNIVKLGKSFVEPEDPISNNGQNDSIFDELDASLSDDCADDLNISDIVQGLIAGRRKVLVCEGKQFNFS